MVFWTNYLHQRIEQLEAEIKSLKELLRAIETEHQPETPNPNSSSPKLTRKQRKNLIAHQKAKDWYHRVLLNNGR